MRCAVYGCRSDNQKKNRTSEEKSIRFYRFPKDAKFCEMWKVKCKRSDDFNVSTATLCSKHFTDESYVRNLMHELLGIKNQYTFKLKKDAVPVLHLPSSLMLTDSNHARHNRSNVRQRKAIISSITEGIKYDIKETNGTVSKIEFQSASHDSESKIRIATLEEEVRLLKQKLESTDDQLQKEVETKLQYKMESEKSKYSLENMTTNLRGIFTEGQIRKLSEPKKNIKWSEEDISKAIVIYATGARAYKLLIKKGYPYPSIRTLQRWCERVQMQSGVLTVVTQIMRNSELNRHMRVCVLSFDEMKIKATYCYDKAHDETLKPANYVQVAMIRGLFGNWKQPIFYAFDCRMTKAVLLDVIKAVESCGFAIHAIVSDLGAGNRILYKELDISYTKPWIANPTDCERNIYVFADVPHLIKLIRNHFIDRGFIMPDGTHLKKTVVEKTLNCSTGDLSITHKLSHSMLNVKGVERQKVKFATKLLSHTTAMAIKRTASLGHLENENWLQCSDFIKKVNDWFDVLNVRVPSTDTRDRMKAFGMKMEVQQPIVTSMSNIMHDFRVAGSKSMLPFQKGIIQTNTALPLLFEDLKKRYGTKYILTHRLNQDVLENFFSVIRSKGGLHDHPDQLEFQHRLRSYIVGHNNGAFVGETNVTEDNTPDLEPTLSAKILGRLNCATQLEENEICTDREMNDLQYDGLENLAGFICHKFKNISPDISVVRADDKSWSWVSQLSEGGLAKPTSEFMEKMKLLEVLFENFNPDNSLTTCRSYLKTLLEIAETVECSYEVKKLFFRSRLFFRIRKLNKSLRESSLKRATLNYNDGKKRKKMQKLTT